MKTTEETIEINKRQKEFYNSDHPKERNFVSNLWAKLRNNLLTDFRRSFDISQRVYAEHKAWMGDLSDKKILDLGCYSGNALSSYMAENAKEYIGIDLSDVAIAKLSENLAKRNLPNAKAKAVDFLSDNDFPDKDFDVIYAYGVLHHFENFDLLVSKLKEKLKPGGIIVSYDPLQTSLPIKFIRALYRPFQSDADWEWPFSKKVLKKLESNFSIESLHGILGKSKYGILLNFMPLNSSFKRRTVASMVEKDWSAKNVDAILPCMHVTMLMRNSKA